MNMFCISDNSFRSMIENLQVAYDNAAIISYRNAVNKTKLTESQSETGLSDHLHNCHIAIDSFHVMSKYYKQCSIWEY